MNDKQRKTLAKMNITFACFKMVISALLTKADIDEDSFVEWYEDYAESVEKYDMSIEEFAEFHFLEFNLDTHPYELRSNQRQWFKPYPELPKNIPYLVLIPEEDNHITTGMLDISGDWVLLDEYRKLTKPPALIMNHPPIPKEYQS